MRTVRALSQLNQRDGFDWPGCAWPENPSHRKHAEFCENGAKAVTEEATTRTVTREFFERPDTHVMKRPAQCDPPTRSAAIPQRFRKVRRRHARVLRRFAPDHDSGPADTAERSSRRQGIDHDAERRLRGGEPCTETDHGDCSDVRRSRLK